MKDWFGFIRLSLFGIAATASPVPHLGGTGRGPPQSLWNRGDCFECVNAKNIPMFAASVSLESRRLLRRSVMVPKHEKPPPQSLWNRGDCFRECFVQVATPHTASVSLESRRLLLTRRASLDRPRRPPQSLWNRGDCFVRAMPWRRCRESASVSLESRRLLREIARAGDHGAHRLSLFGIAATASQQS